MAIVVGCIHNDVYMDFPSRDCMVEFYCNVLVVFHNKVVGKALTMPFMMPYNAGHGREFVYKNMSEHYMTHSQEVEPWISTNC